MLRLVTAIVAIVAASAAALAQDNSGPTEPAYLYRANVVNIVDGDTIDVDIDLGFYIWIRSQRIRLLDIDAPEKRGESKEAGLAATDHLKNLIDGKTIILQTVKGRDESDRSDSFGRWLGVIFLDGINVNQEMIRAGHAVPYED